MSFQQAIVVTGAFNTDAGINAEYSWIGRFYKGHRVVCRALIRREDKFYDVFVLRSRSGGEHRLHFDVTEFFGTPDSRPDETPPSTARPIEPKAELYTENPQTQQERNANKCVELDREGAMTVTAALTEEGYAVVKQGK